MTTKLDELLVALEDVAEARQDYRAKYAACDGPSPDYYCRYEACRLENATDRLRETFRAAVLEVVSSGAKP